VRQQRQQPPRAWLEIISGGAGRPALAAAYPVSGPGTPGAPGPAAVTAILSAGPRGPLVIADKAGALAAWDPARPGSPAVFRPATSHPCVVAPLADGRVLARGHTGALEAWDVPQHRGRPGGEGAAGDVTAMACFPDQRILVTATKELTSGWHFDGSAANGRRWGPQPGARWLVRLGGGRVLAVSEGGPAGQAGQAFCLDASDGARIWRESLSARPRAVAVDEVRGLLAIGSADRRVTLRELGSGHPVAADLDAGDVPMALAFVPTTRPGDITLLVGRADGWLARHPVSGGGPGGLLPAHRSAVGAIWVDPEAGLAVTGGSDGWIKAWDLDAGEWAEFGAARQVRAAAFDADGQWALACCGREGSYLADAGGRWTALPGPAVARDPVLAPLPAGLGMVVSLRDGALGWVPNDGSALRTVPLPPALRVVTALAAADDGTSVFVADSGGGLSLVPLRATSAANDPVPAGSPLTALAGVADRAVLAGDTRGGLTTWAASGPRGLSAAGRHQLKLPDVTALAVAENRGAVVAGGRDGDVVLAHDSEETRLGRHGARVTLVAVGLGGGIAVTASEGDEPTLCVWDLAASGPGEPLTRLPLADAAIAVAFRPGQPELTVLDRPGRLRRLQLHLPG
jgi:hypothetical protein